METEVPEIGSTGEIGNLSRALEAFRDSVKQKFAAETAANALRDASERRERDRAAEKAAEASQDRDAIYKGSYWDRIHGDDLPTGLDFAVFDAAVNSGIATATMWLQAALNIDVDGDFGPATIKACQNLQGDDVDVIRAMCARRLGSLKRLRTWSRFGAGWSARITNVQKTAVSWAQAGTSAGSVHPAPVDVTSGGGNQRVDINDVMVSPISQAAAHITTAGSAVATAATQVGTQLAPAVDTFAWLKYVLGGLTVLSAIVGVGVMFSKQWSDAAQNAEAVTKVDPTADEKFPAVILPAEPVAQAAS